MRALELALPLGLCVATLSAVPMRAEADDGWLRGGPRLVTGLEQTRDDRFNDTRYAGAALGVGGFFELRSGNVEHATTLTLSGAYLTNRLNFDHLLFGLDLAYRVRFHLPLELAEGRFDTGLRVGGGPRFGLYVPEDPEHIAWATAYDLGPSARWSREMEGGELSVELTPALFGLVSRPGSYTNRNNDKPRVGYIVELVHGNAELATWPSYGAVRATIAWRQPWESWFSRFSIDLLYQRFAEPEPMNILDYRLLVDFGFGS